MLREWAPLTELFNKLPTKIKKGLFQNDIKLTCVDVLTEYLVLGTNVGLIFLFDRKTKNLLKFPSEKNNVSITCVRILSTVDYMVACASETGSITIFQIPKSHPDSLPESLKPKTKQIEKYIVTELHKSPVTTLEWSKNGMKLFSGDKNGLVVLTEIDFYMHICKSIEILNEAYEVVQLSYSQQHLLVSTTYRSIICKQSDTWKVSQIGKKDRKILGQFGALIFQKSYKVSESSLYCTRPGLRIWIADIDGNVQNTLLFKDLLSKECPEVPIINPVPKKIQSSKVQKEASFGILLPFDEKFLVTYNGDTVYILDSKKMVVVAVISQLRSVLDIATYKDEIFILEEDRSLIRISYNPEPETNADLNNTFCNAYFPFSSPLKGLTEKFQSGYPDLGRTIDIYTDENAIMYVEEATSSPSRTNMFDNQEKFEKVNKQKFSDEILFKKSSKSDRNSRMTQSAYSASSSSNSSCERDNSSLFMNSSFNGVLPDVRSLDTIKCDIAEKERMLEKLLDLDKVEIPDISRLKKITHDFEANLDSSDIPTNKNDIKPIKHVCDSPKPVVSNKKGSTSNQETGKVKLVAPMEGTRAEKHGSFVGTPCDTIAPKKLFSDVSKSVSNKQELASCQETDEVKHLVPMENTKAPKNEPFVGVPSCSPVPSKWVLSDIHIVDRQNSSISESSMSDWEIL